MSTVNWMFTLLIVLISVFAVRGSHFDGGSISYKVIGTNGSRLVVSITQSYTYVYPTIYCNNTYIANQLSLKLTPYADATATLDCIANCSTDGGYTPIPVASKCTDFSVGMAITVGQRTDDVILNNGSYFIVAYQGTAFRNLSLAGVSTSSQNWSISAVIDLRIRPDGTYNTPPKATMISPIFIPVGIQQTISIPTIDADNDNVRCRFANGSNECSSVCPPTLLPSGTSISSDCALTITGAKAGDWYAVAIQAEDFGNSTSTTPYSSVPVQFLVHVYAQPNCTQRPYLYGPGLDGTCTGVQVGVPYTLTLIAENYCSSYGVTMVDIATQSFPVVIKTPIVQNTTTLWSVSLTWTPTADEVGPQVFCSVGVDSQGVQTNQYCLTFTVGSGTLGTCPGVEITTEVMTTSSTTTSSTTTSSTTTSSTTTSTTTTQSTTTSSTTTSSTTTSTTTTQSTTAQSTTTEPPTTTTPIQNTTTANNTSSSITVIIVPVIIIPICCCCCCCCLFYLIRPCPTIDAERERKPVTTYTIEGAYENKADFLIGKNYQNNENDANNNGSLTDTSYTTLHDINYHTEYPSTKSLLTVDNDHNLSQPSTDMNVPVALNRNSVGNMMHHDPLPSSPSKRENVQAIPNTTGKNINGVQTTISYDRYPPLQSSAQINTSSAPATAQSYIYRENIQQRSDPLHSTSLPQSPILSSQHRRVNDDSAESNARKTITPWTKHPRWVLRLSEPKQIHTPPLTPNPSISKEPPHNNLSSSAKSTSTIPRYAFSYE